MGDHILFCFIEDASDTDGSAGGEFGFEEQLWGIAALRTVFFAIG